MILPHGAMSWPALCDFGFSWSYSLTFHCLAFYENAIIKQFDNLRTNSPARPIAARIHNTLTLIKGFTCYPNRYLRMHVW